MNPIVWPWMVEIGLITYRSVTGEHISFTLKGATTQNTGVKRPPLPSELLASFVAFGMFAAIAEKDKRIGSLLGWGIVVATAITMFGSKPLTASTSTTTPASTASTTQSPQTLA
jgi:hypothetical protein